MKFCLAILLLVYSSANSQLSKKKQELVAYLAAGVGSKSQHMPIEGNFPVQFPYTGAIHTGLERRFLLNWNWCFAYGVNFSVHWSKMSIDYPVYKMSPAYTGYEKLVAREHTFLLSIPVSMEYRFRQEKPTTGYVKAGLSVNTISYPTGYGTSYAFFDKDSNFVTVFQQDSQPDEEWGASISVQFGGGIRWRIKNSGKFQAGILLDLSLMRVIYGSYSIYVPG